MGKFDNVLTPDEIKEYEQRLIAADTKTENLLELLKKANEIQKEAYSILVKSSREIAIYEHLLRIKDIQRTIYFGNEI